MRGHWRRGVSGALLASAVLLLLNATLLRVLGFELGEQVVVVLALAVATLAGSAFLWRARGAFPDRVSFLLGGFLLGLVVAGAVLFVLLHREVYLRLGLSSVIGATRVGAAILSIPAGIGAWLVVRGGRWDVSWTATPLALPLTLAAALGIGAATCYGAFGERVAELSGVRASVTADWGNPLDKDVHVIEGPAVIASTGFPLETDAVPGASGVFGFETLLVGLAALGGEGLEVGAIQGMRWLAFAVWAALLYLFFSLSRRLFELTAGQALLVAVAAVLFGPIPPAPFQLRFSAFTGFLWSSGAMYHNLPQLLSVAIGGAGVFLVLSGLERERGAFLAGAVLVSGSFFFKPSLYTAAGPAILLWVPLLGRRLERARVLGLFVLLLPIAVWIVYPHLFEGPVAAKSLNPAIAPFEVLFHHERVFPPLIAGHPVSRALAILVFSLALPLFVLVAHARSVGARLFAGSGSARLARLREHLPHLVLATLLLLGLASALLCVERNSRRWDENFLWAAAAGIQLALPLLVAGVSRVRPPSWRSVGLALLALHLWGGVQHLVLFVRGGV